MPGRKANGAKLPSEGLRLNASKSESRPDPPVLYALSPLGGNNIPEPVTVFGSGVMPERCTARVLDTSTLVDTISN